MVYQKGTPPGSPEDEYYGGSAFTNCVRGAIVLDNATWIYPNSGYEPAQIGGLLARHAGFVADCETPQDYNAVYAVERHAVLDPGSCVVYCNVKGSSITGLDDLQDVIQKGKEWIVQHEIDCPMCPSPCPPDFLVGDANDSGGCDIDDVVYLIAYIFSGGPPPTPCTVTSGDANCSCKVDIDDVVYLIAYIFSGGPAPCTCEEWFVQCDQPREPLGCQW
jgi:hypothetical protein